MGVIARASKTGGGTAFVSGRQLNPLELNQDLNTLYTELNGIISNANIKAAAGIVPSKLGFSGARVNNSANISIDSGVDTALTFNTEQYDTDAYHSTSSNTGRLTIPETSFYYMTASVQFAANATGYRFLLIGLNATPIYIVHVSNPATTAGAVHVASVSTVLSLAAGDYLQLFVNQSSGGPLNVEAVTETSPVFTIMKLGYI